MDFTTYTDAQLDDLAVQVAQEQRNRRIIAEAPGQADALAASYWAASGRKDGDPWVQPVGSFDAYPMGTTVTHGGKTWVNLTAANVWEPPVNWRQVTDPGGNPPAWVQPTGMPDAYSFGDRVTFEGHIWRSVNAGTNTNVWSPSAYPAAWFDEGPAAP